MITNPPLALALVAARKIDFDDAFCLQFLLTKNSELVVGNFARKPAGEWTLYYGDGLPVIPLKDSNNDLVGYFLGIGVDEAGQLVSESFCKSLSQKTPNFLETIEDAISKIAGRYIVILTNPQWERMYFDPCGTLSAVYNPQTKTVASSVMLCLDRDVKDNPDFNNDAVTSGEESYMLQNTRDVDVKLIIANHYLDLKDFSMTRHWPKPDQEFTATPEEYPEIAADIDKRLAEIFGAIVQSYKSVVPITGGVDSRNLIAAGKKNHKDVDLFFTFGHNFMSENDTEVAEIIAEKLNVPFQAFDRRADETRELPKGFHKRQMLYQYMIASGYSFVTPPEVQQDLLEYLPKGAVHLRGNVVDLLKDINFPKDFATIKSAKKHREIELRGLFRYRTPSDQELAKWMPTYMKWFKTLPKNAHKLSYDFKYMELSLPLSSQLFYGMSHNFYIYPFADRRLIINAMRFPLSFRKSGNAARYVLNASMPELSDIPYLREHINIKRAQNA